MVVFSAYVVFGCEYSALRPVTVNLAGLGDTSFVPMCDGRLWPGNILVGAGPHSTPMAVYALGAADGVLSQLSGTRDILAPGEFTLCDMCHPFCRGVLDIEESFALLAHRLRAAEEKVAAVAGWRDAAVSGFLSGLYGTVTEAKTAACELLPPLSPALRKTALTRRRPRVFISPGADIKR